jgi:excisionase family DNA binding protein
VLTVKEVSKYLKIHPGTAYRLVNAGELPAFKVGGNWRFSREEIDRWRLQRGTKSDA